MRYSKAKSILEACQMTFNGVPIRKVAAYFDVAPNTIRNWGKTEIWQTLEQQLLDAEMEKALQTQLNINAGESPLAQG